jgi:hypothetical protein
MCSGISLLTETSVNFQWTIWRYILGDGILHSNRYEYTNSEAFVETYFVVRNI